ncbi:hypothetical protein DPMN_031331 [Dreissena polymorpha]|uniref:Uncharacterized protein n=1 Tax=Dreissena polymorpha TaxID=45954 RepID=A0A9D4M251_DREPO|nr:hypothetical protein DPMN_031331 [Dreissena polymorpha]
MEKSPCRHHITPILSTRLGEFMLYSFWWPFRQSYRPISTPPTNAHLGLRIISRSLKYRSPGIFHAGSITTTSFQERKHTSIIIYVTQLNSGFYLNSARYPNRKNKSSVILSRSA